MAELQQGILGLIGHTPLVEIPNFEKLHKLKARLAVKLESFNPGGGSGERVSRHYDHAGDHEHRTEETFECLRRRSGSDPGASGNAGGY